MTTDLQKVALGLLLGLGLLAFGCQTGRSGRRGGLPPHTVAKYPPEIREAYDLFAVRCSRCHTLSRPLNAGIYDHEHWENYVARMRRQSGSGISPKDAEKILVFLRFYADQKAADRDPVRTSSTGAVR